MKTASLSSVAIALALLSLSVLAPAASFADWQKLQSFSLREYTDPAYARTGTLDFWYNPSLKSAPYGYPYQVIFSIGSVCKSTVSDAGGAADGWFWGYTTDYSVISQFDPYADTLFYFPYGPAVANDGSWGEDYPCQGGKTARNGWFYIFSRMSDYTYTYHDTGPYFYGTYYHVGDFLDCSNELGCQWYYLLLD